MIFSKILINQEHHPLNIPIIFHFILINECRLGKLNATKASGNPNASIFVNVRYIKEITLKLLSLNYPRSVDVIHVLQCLLAEDLQSLSMVYQNYSQQSVD